MSALSQFRCQSDFSRSESESIYNRIFTDINTCHLNIYAAMYYIKYKRILITIGKSQRGYLAPGWHNLRGVLTSWLDPEFGPQNTYVEILATFATKMLKTGFLQINNKALNQTFYNLIILIIKIKNLVKIDLSDNLIYFDNPKKSDNLIKFDNSNNLI